jgi:hypothetical protein
LIVDGTSPHSVKNTQSQLLDADDSDYPDSDFRAPLSWRNLVLDLPGPNSAGGSGNNRAN